MSDISMTEPYAAPVAPVSLSDTGLRFKYSGTGGELFKELIVGFLLTCVTLGIYGPWFIVALNKYTYSRTTLQTSKGEMRFEFTGTGGDLFVKGLVGYLLTIITLGIYGPWFIVSLIKFNADSSKAVGADDTRFRVGFTGTGGELFVAIFVGYLLSIITLGIYLPWFICNLQKLIFEKMTIYENDQATGTLDFVGEGGALFVTAIVGYLLTIITFGIYGSWFNVSITKFMNQSTRVKAGGRTWAGDFSGTGGQLFVLTLIGTLLTIVTFGIYFFWYLTNFLKFHLENTTWRDA